MTGSIGHHRGEPCVTQVRQQIQIGCQTSAGPDDPIGKRPQETPQPDCLPIRTSTAEMGEHWTKLPMISTLDDICWKWSKRASSTSIVASLYRLAVVPLHLAQQWDRDVA